jgi:dTDP-4-amino-4,6-dideoxygalactose transaminase
VPRARIVHRRRANYSEYARLFAGMKGARALFPELPEAAAPYVFPLYVDRPGASYQPLRAAGVPIYRWDEVWRGTPMLAGDCGPDWSQRVFQLGCHQDLSTEDIGAIAATTRKIVAGAR